MGWVMQWIKGASLCKREIGFMMRSSFDVSMEMGKCAFQAALGRLMLQYIRAAARKPARTI